MIKLPNFKHKFDYENNFYLSCDPSRMTRIIAHYELFKLVKGIPGDVFECGVFKGTALARFAMFQDRFGGKYKKKIVGFDTFDKFPKSSLEADKRYIKKFTDEAGKDSISISQMRLVMMKKNLQNLIELVPGDISKTAPEYIKKHPNQKISLLNLDVDIYDPSKVILEHFYSKISRGGILVLDEYGLFPGETKAVDEYFKSRPKINYLPFCKSPCYIIKK
jgi:hypothetical protein